MLFSDEFKRISKAPSVLFFDEAESISEAPGILSFDDVVRILAILVGYFSMTLQKSQRFWVFYFPMRLKTL